MDIRDCPICGLPADVMSEHTFISTSGPLTMTRLRCIAGHIVDTYVEAEAVD